MSEQEMLEAVTIDTAVLKEGVWFFFITQEGKTKKIRLSANTREELRPLVNAAVGKTVDLIVNLIEVKLRVGSGNQRFLREIVKVY